MTTSEEVDELTEKVLGLLTEDPMFIKEWTRTTVEMLEENLQEESSIERKIDEFEVTVEELVRVIAVATQYFLDSESSMYRFADPNTNPDASTIFAVHLQMHRLDSYPDIPRFLTAVRRLTQLAKKFPTRLSHGCNVPSVLKLATSICEMLYSLQEHLQALREISTTVLSRSASDFNRIVVEKLELWKRELDSEKRLQTVKTPSPLVKATRRRPLSQIQFRKPGGFLMSLELVKARQSVISRSRSATPSRYRQSNLGNQSVPQVDPSQRQQKRTQMAGQMEEKWGKLLEIDNVIRRTLPTKGPTDSDDGSITLRVAKHISAQVIHDLRKRLDGRPPLILS